MKNSKRLLTVGLILTMLVSLAACSPDKTKEGGLDATETQTTDVGAAETDATNADATETDVIGTEDADVDATETEDINVDATEADTDVDASEADTDATADTELVRRSFGDIVMPATLEEIPAAFEEVSKSFTSEITEEQLSNGLELFTIAVSAELANDSETATAAWKAFDELNLVQQ